MSFRKFALGACIAFLFVVLIARPESRPQNLMRDFNAFYCAGKTIAQHADPYRNEPLGACERSEPRPDFLESGPASLAVPAPLPGYALAPFALLALLPYGLAAGVWTCMLLASFALTIHWLRALTTLPLYAIVASLALSDGYVGVTLGQIAPLAIAAAVGAAYAIARKKTLLAACAGATAMLEPHIGLPACIALAAFRPRTIAPLALLGTLCAWLSLALLGAQENIEYFTSVIGSHALSETLNVKQLSLTTLLAHAGFPALLAVRIGTLWYAAMILAGIAIGRRTARRLERPALAVLLPVAFAMIGGPFVHIAQIAAVLPAALLLADAPPKSKIAAISIMLLAVPWPQFATLGTSFPIFAALTAGTLAFYLLPATPTWRIMPPLLTLVLTQMPTQLLTPIADPSARLRVLYDPHALAQTSWSAYVALVGTQNNAAYDLARIPTLLGLVSFLYAVCRIMQAKRIPDPQKAHPRQG